jgi:nitrogen fixation NifU-like protein
MTGLTDLYQSLILDHNRSPRNFRAIEGADRRALGRNPLCGDELTVWVKLAGDRIDDVSFVGAGCAISKASASMMTQAVAGKTRAEAAALFEGVHALVTGRLAPAAAQASVGRSLAALGGVSRFPVRVKCASMAWHTMKAALAESDAGAGTG